MPQLLPHGWYSLIPPVLATMAWTSSLFQDGCDYVRLKGSVVQALADSDAPFLEAGFDAYREPRYNPAKQEWELVYSGTCLEYPDEPFDIGADPYWRMAKFFDFISVVLGGAGAFFLWFSTACVFSPGTWRWTGYEILAAAIIQFMSFLWFDNLLCNYSGPDGQEPTTCEMSWGAKMDIVAGVLWLTAAVLMFSHYPHAVDGWFDGQDDDEDGDDDEYEDDDEDEFEDIDLPPIQTEDGYIKASPTNEIPEAGQVSGEASREDEPKGMHVQIV